jgi:pimeloyl-ACP methyl ester carboxylesterase
MRILLALCLLSAPVFCAPKSETGDLNGAKFRIDVPDNWNGGLVMYCHGYNPMPVSFDEKVPPISQLFLSFGYAVAQSGYVAGGWAIEEAVDDTEALRRYFSRKYGAPKETFVTGHSMGGFLTMTLLEMFPNEYDGGLALCGPLGPASWFMGRRVFDIRVVFDYYFPGALPNPVKIPKDFMISPARNAEVQKLLDSSPEKAAAVRRWSGLRDNKDAAATIVLFTYLLKDLEERARGNPFDNRNIVYEGTGADDNALNDHVTRYKSDPKAVAYLRRYYTPTGHLTRPMLAIHTTYDPLVPPWTPNMYQVLTERADSEQFFVQQYVKRAGHCAITPQEIGKGFQELRQWTAVGTRPPAGDTTVSLDRTK